MIFRFSQSKYRFQLFDNINRLTWQQIQQETGCYALCNLWYFSMLNYTHQAAVMLEGEWARTPEYDWPGICIDRDGRVTTGGTDDAVWDYAASVQADYIGGEQANATPWGPNGVTYTGLTAQGDVVILLCSRDTPMDSREAVSAMLDAGCVDVLRWDGSWSSQGTLGPGLDVQPSEERICRGWLLIFEREETLNNMDDITVAIMDESACYKAGRKINPKGIMVHSTATPGVMSEQIRSAWNNQNSDAAVHAIIDDKHTLMTLPWSMRGWHAGIGTSGNTANDTHISFEICEPEQCRLLPIEWISLSRSNNGTNHWAVKRLQMELQARGYDPNGIDGSFGPGCEAALKEYQKDAGLEVDGSCGPATLKALSEREGSYLKYSPDETKEYFEAVWQRAVSLCVKLCNAYQIDCISGIICHAEGYGAGIASNHADVEHWFPMHGKTMDDFRNAVHDALYIEGEQKPDEKVEWYTDAQNWAVDIGITDGTRPLDNVTRAEVWTMLKRLHEVGK